jgi:myo-inositol 2-dehydrogenase/D-chiro-inositol 1-dehydrogenase
MNATNHRPSGESWSRRRFLASTAAGAALGSLALARSVHAAGSDVIKVGLIGCGGRGSGAAANALNAGTDVRLVALADVFEDRVKAAQTNLKKFKPEQVAVNDDHCFVGFDAYKKLIASDVDVVLIACASKFHPAYMKAAIDAGKHVFVEKPHAIDPPGIHIVQQAVEDAKKKNLCVVSGLCWRYHTGVQETMKRVLDGAIGDIVAIQETYMRSAYRLIEREPSWNELEYQFRNWYHFRWLSGDDCPQSLLHSMDKGQWALHEQTPVQAFGSGGRSSCFGPVYGDVFDHSAIVYEYANGVRMYANVRAQNGCYGETSDTFLGTKGRCYLLKHRIEGETNWQYQGPKCNMYDAEHQVLFDAIRRGEPINNGEYMVRSTMMSILGTMVCYTGRQITWDDAMKSAWREGPETCSWDMDPPVKPGPDGTYAVPVPGLTKLA